jgi:monomeric type NADP-dependent isocitrate dehydrogenase
VELVTFFALVFHHAEAHCGKSDAGQNAERKIGQHAARPTAPWRSRRCSHKQSATHHHLHPDRRGAAAGHCAFLPIIRAFTAPAGINVDTSDISVAARVLGEFPECLTEAQRVPDTLAELGKLTLQPEANIIKLPNISASVAQLKAASRSCRARATPFPTTRKTPRPMKKRPSARYGKCIGSAVNPVLREGNSDRRAPRAVKEYARKNPHSMAEWSQASRSHVSHMHAWRLLPR